MLCCKKKNLNDKLFEACRDGNIYEVNELINKGANNWHLSFVVACAYGKLEIVEMILQRGRIIDYNRGLTHACGGEFDHVVEVIICHHRLNKRLKRKLETPIYPSYTSGVAMRIRLNTKLAGYYHLLKLTTLGHINILPMELMRMLLKTFIVSTHEN